MLYFRLGVASLGMQVKAQNLPFMITYYLTPTFGVICFKYYTGLQLCEKIPDMRVDMSAQLEIDLERLKILGFQLDVI